MPVGEEEVVNSSEELLQLIARQDEDVVIEPETPAQVLVDRRIRNELEEVFAPIPGGPRPFRLNPFIHDDNAAVAQGRFEFVSWEWVGVNHRSFLGVPPTGRVVWIRAMTVVEQPAGAGPLFHDFIDWHRVLIQLGVAPQATRPIVDGADIARLELFDQ